MLSQPRPSVLEDEQARLRNGVLGTVVGCMPTVHLINLRAMIHWIADNAKHDGSE